MHELMAVWDQDVLGKALWVSLLCAGTVVTLLALDLGLLHKDDREIGARESPLHSAGCLSVALLFGAFLVVTGVPMWRAVEARPELHGKAFFVQQLDPAKGQAVRWVAP